MHNPNQQLTNTQPHNPITKSHHHQSAPHLTLPLSQITKSNSPRVTQSSMTFSPNLFPIPCNQTTNPQPSNTLPQSSKPAIFHHNSFQNPHTNPKFITSLPQFHQPSRHLKSPKQQPLPITNTPSPCSSNHPSRRSLPSKARRSRRRRSLLSPERDPRRRISSDLCLCPRAHAQAALPSSP